ncbi:MAG: hypothetical protein IT581_02635 [Verrucomicrobiales bacterium]|nr:hypothetical protein [Verrucomicrobiales bacterium]
MAAGAVGGGMTLTDRGWAAVVAIALLAGGCASVDPLAPATRGEVQAGMAISEVHQRLGSPTYYEQAPSGRSVETYEVLQTIFGKFGVREREEALEIRQFSVRYDAAGRVEKTLQHRGVLEGFTRLHSRSLGPEITREQVSQVRSGISTRADVEKLFGPASQARLDPESGVRLEWIYDVVESSAVTPGRAYRSIEVTLDEGDVVRAVKVIDRVFPAWRR